MTIDDLRLRHSVRIYTDREIPGNIESSLRAAITDINTHEAGMHFQLFTNDSAPFAGFKRSYGMFKNVRNYIACVADTSYADYMERAGYFGMQLVMKAFCAGLDTCFVGGTFSVENVAARVRVGQKLLFLITLGYGAEKKQTNIAGFLTKIMHHNDLSPMDFLDTEQPWEDICLKYPGLLKGLEAVSYAPSSLNKQPVGILIKKAESTYNPVVSASKKAIKEAERKNELNDRYNGLIQSTPESATETPDFNKETAGSLVLQAYVPAKNPKQLIDLGIAMFCFQAAYPGYWTWGNPATFHPD